MLIPSWMTTIWRPQLICLPGHSRLWKKKLIPRFKFAGSSVVLKKKKGKYNQLIRWTWSLNWVAEEKGNGGLMGYVPIVFEGRRQFPLTMLERSTMALLPWGAQARGQGKCHDTLKAQLPLAPSEPSHATALSRRGLATGFSAQRWPTTALQDAMGYVVVGLAGGQIHPRLYTASPCYS